MRDTGLGRDVAHARAVVAVPGEYPDRGVEDAPAAKRLRRCRT
jgi:hypothetical protein